ncbi:hydroxyacylglutathione hydrolase [Coxiella endosymbiont of Amblyomma americanum]|uniref:hydroxyacylglutathione hydrolase n=1 Tax=Coxiella endosymbiont of Amblyomma americanum TaxID=325775 RepID=UPI00057F7E3E|nr:hydroxyacylglutathione hydrolase [Coxiella endosymbiont of Amblyomma americanum]AJC50466.1 hydroxyacylglutathione hydrolase [Coxiella endosymbiont of Amblyomma americanum]AUJ58807.1 hydroxyacylglutathione hydrolase [Coxiella-like endosymbiont of Amblyomma americanum]
MSHVVFSIPALCDNHVWIVVCLKKRNAIVIDPGEAKPVLDTFEKSNLTLTAILLTHYHWDHINGISGLLERYPVPVYGPSENLIPLCSHPLQDRDYLTLPSLGITFNILTIPGHTVEHIAYYCKRQWVFTGDTLFTGGCGRIFTGTPYQLYQSLCRLAALPSNTQVYCGHEYTKKNLEFAQIVDPNNLNLKKRVMEIKKKINNNSYILPSTLQLEINTNPFLRCDKKDIKKSLGKYYGCSFLFSDTIAVFSALRQWKNEF